jgi:TPR repeat protein
MTQSVEWYRKAADLGRASSQYLLAGAYLQGTGVSQDFSAFARWNRLAADQGHAGAQFAMGVAYEQGVGVAADPVQAYLWYSLAGVQGHAQAAKNLTALTPSLSAAQRSEGERLLREWKPQRPS